MKAKMGREGSTFVLFFGTFSELAYPFDVVRGLTCLMGRLAR